MLENEMISKLRNTVQENYGCIYLLNVMFPTAVLAFQGEKKTIIDFITREEISEREVKKCIETELIPLLDKAYFPHGNESDNQEIANAQSLLFGFWKSKNLVEKWGNALRWEDRVVVLDSDGTMIRAEVDRDGNMTSKAVAQPVSDSDSRVGA